MLLKKTGLRYWAINHIQIKSILPLICNPVEIFTVRYGFFFVFCSLSLASLKQYYPIIKMFYGMHYIHSYMISFSPCQKNEKEFHQKSVYLMRQSNFFLGALCRLVTECTSQILNFRRTTHNTTASPKLTHM